MPGAASAGALADYVVVFLQGLQCPFYCPFGDSGLLADLVGGDCRLFGKDSQYFFLVVG